MTGDGLRPSTAAAAMEGVAHGRSLRSREDPLSARAGSRRQTPLQQITSSAGQMQAREECKVTYWAGGTGRVRIKTFEPVASTIWSVTGRSFGEFPPSFRLPAALPFVVGLKNVALNPQLWMGMHAWAGDQRPVNTSKPKPMEKVDAMEFARHNVSIHFSFSVTTFTMFSVPLY
jgi:hypothetical protein